MRKINKRGTGTCILFLSFLILVTVLFILEEIKKPSIPKTQKPSIEKETLEKKEKIFPEPIPAKKPETYGKIVLIIDDVGWNPDIIASIKRINAPITLAILPESPFGLKIAKQISKNKNVQIILHIPLESENLSENTKISQEFLTTKMTDEEIKEKTDEYLTRFSPYIAGVNNHMGSKFTKDSEKMEAFLEKIKEKKLVYVDSLTTKDSVGYSLAKKMGIPAVKRDVFIDNSADYEEISTSLERTAKMSIQKGTIIAICHARQQTLKVLEDKIPQLKEQGYKFILISDAVQ